MGWLSNQAAVRAIFWLEHAIRDLKPARGALAVLAILAAYFFVGWAGSVVLGVVLIAALVISYRVVTDSESED